MRPKGIRPERKASTAISLAAFITQAAAFECSVCERYAGEASGVGSFKGESVEALERQWCGGILKASVCSEGVGYGQVHVGYAELRLYGAVGKLHHRMHYRLGMYHGLYLLRSYAEQEVRLDYFIRQLGCLRASAAVAFSISAAERVRKGPPEAVISSLRTLAVSSPRRHCAMAECSESTG